MHHILVDGVPLCRLTEPWAQFFTCFFQWESTARQAAMKIANMQANKGRRVDVVRGKCVCGK